MNRSTQLRSGMNRTPLPIGEFAGAAELAGSAERHHQGRMDLGPVVTSDVVRQLVKVVGESVLRVGALMDLGEEVTGDSHIHPAVAHGFLQVDSILPLDLVADVVLMPLAIRIPGVERLVGDAEGDRTGGRVEIAAAWVAAVLVPEPATGLGIDRRMPGGIQLAVGTHHRIAIVDLPGAGVPVAWGPLAIGVA